MELPRKIVAACQRNGIARLLHMSALNAGPGQPSAYLRTKGEGERIVMSSGLNANGFQAIRYFRPGRLIAKPVCQAGALPVLPLGSPDAKFQPVFVEDVVQAFAGSLDAPHTIGHSYDLCGPNVTACASWLNMRRTLPDMTPRLSASTTALSYLQALMLEFLPGKLMTRDNYFSMKVDNICDCDGPGNLTRVWGIQPTAIEEVAPLYLAQRMPRERYDEFRQGHGR